jgi:hypothetical protein
VYAYLSNFVIAIDVADRLIDSLLASATIDLGDEEARTAFLHPVALRERSPQLVPKNTGTTTQTHTYTYTHRARIHTPLYLQS